VTVELTNKFVHCRIGGVTGTTASAGPQRQRDPERTRQEILDVALSEFARNGYAGARVDEIAARTRTTKRMLYYYFTNKEQLYIAVLEQALAAKQQLLGAGHSQLLPYYFFLAQLHLAEGSLPAAVALDRQALEVCEKNDGPDSACAGAMLVGLGNGLAANGIYGEAESTLAGRWPFAISSSARHPRCADGRSTA